MRAEPTLFIIDSDPSVREAVCEMLTGYGLRTETFVSVQEFLTQYTPDRPGCILLDISIPGISGLERVNGQNPRPSSVCLAAYTYVSLLAVLKQMDQMEIVQKPFQKEDLIQRVQMVVEEDAEARNYQGRQIEFSKRFKALTAREHQVLERVVEGKSTKIIATELGSSYHTVRNQRSSILRKLKADTVVDAVRMVSECRGYEYYHHLMGLSTA